MSDIVAFSLALGTGGLLGAFFFGGLWWTIRKGLTSDHSALWFLGSTLLRTTVAVAGFYFIGSGDWRKMMLCLGGFFVARLVVTRLTKEETHAP